MSDDKSFLGKSAVLEDPVVAVNPDSPKLLNFRCWERPGLTAMKADRKPDGTYDFDTLRPLNKREDLKPGDKILFDWPGGGLIELTVNADVTWAESESISTSLEFHPGFPEGGYPPEWTGSCFMNNKALTRVDFS